MSDDNKAILGACLEDVDYFVKRFERRAGGPEGDRFAPPLDRLRLLRERIEFLLSGDGSASPTNDSEVMGRLELEQRFNRLNLTLASLLERFAAMPARLEDGLVDMDSSFRSLADRFDSLTGEIAMLRAEQSELRGDLEELRGFEESRSDRDRILDDHLATLDGRLELLSVSGIASETAPVVAPLASASAASEPLNAELLRHLQKMEGRQEQVDRSVANVLEEVQVIRSFLEGTAEAFGVISQSGRFRRPNRGPERASPIRARTAVIGTEAPTKTERPRASLSSNAPANPASNASQATDSFLGLTAEEQAALAEIESEVAAAGGLSELTIEDRSAVAVEVTTRVVDVPDETSSKRAALSDSEGKERSLDRRASDGFRFTIDDLDI